MKRRRRGDKRRWRREEEEEDYKGLQRNTNTITPLGPYVAV